MTCDLSILLHISAEIHEIDGGGYWAEVPRFPGCVAQGETIEALKANITKGVHPSALRELDLNVIPSIRVVVS